MHLSHFLSNKDNELIFGGARASLFMPIDGWTDRYGCQDSLIGFAEALGGLGRPADDVTA